jgi:hypothetical protein
MRRTLAFLTLPVLTLLALPSGALATPTVSFKPTVLPIHGFPGTGDFLGAGAAVQAEFHINGTESAGGVPSQLRTVSVYLPAGTRVSSKGFKTCSVTTLEASGPSACPKGSAASPVGRAIVTAPIGGTTVTEPATIEAFLAPGGGLNFYNVGTSPIAATIIAKGGFQSGGAGYGPKLVTEIPPIPTVPGAPNASVTFINVKVGAAIRKGHKIISYGTSPSKCPKGGFKWKTELTFESGETVTSFATTKCPKKHK